MIKRSHIKNLGEFEELDAHYLTSITKPKIEKLLNIRSHVFVVMLAYKIVKELLSLWMEIDIKVKEGLHCGPGSFYKR